MCTLIAGVGLLGPGTLVIGANRDEAPDRPASDPEVLHERPRVVGGRDRAAGGTWLAVREARFVAALMNRPPSSGGAAAGGRALRSRGLLCLDAAAAGPAIDAPRSIDPGTGEPYPARLEAARALIERERYAACTLAGFDVEGEAWSLRVEEGTAPEARRLDAGWHVITHADPDDRDEPRTAWLLDRLAGVAPRSVEDALAAIAGLLREHGDPSAGIPGACIHRARFPTVSSSLLALGALGRPRYVHAPGPPCVTPYADVSDLLSV